MCRFAAYLGQPIAINEVLSKPKDSLIKQSSQARESEVTINADGFGIGWYSLEISPRPGVFVSLLPAWNDINLHNISHQVSSSCFFGHVRAAAEGGVSLYNCHPFHYQKFLFMHNGGVAGFKKIKRDLINLLPESLYLNIKGGTDSEHLFALWLSYFLPTKQNMEDMADAWRMTLEKLRELQANHHVTEADYINAAVTDGTRLSVVRYSQRTKDNLSLYYAAGRQFQHSGHGCHMVPPLPGHANQAVLVVSERLTNFESEWHEVPAQHILLVSPKYEIQLEAI